MNEFAAATSRSRTTKLMVLILACLSIILISCCPQPPLPPAPETLPEFEAATAGKDSEAIAHFVLETYHCQDCHQINDEHKLILTDEMQQKAPPFQGCKPLLAGMNVIMQVPTADRTSDQQRMADQFQEYGCTFCHQISPGKLGLTDIGDKLGFFHQGCKEGFCCADSKTSD